MGQLLSNLANGSLVKLNEGAELKRFYKLDTDHYGEGTGCTMLRKESTAGVSTNPWRYPSSMGDYFCNVIFPASLDPEIQDCLIPVSLPTSVCLYDASKATKLITLVRKGFSLSWTEVDPQGINYGVKDGTYFSIFADIGLLAYPDDNISSSLFTTWWLRSTRYNAGVVNGTYYSYVNWDSPNFSASTSYGYGSMQQRPAFNLRSDIVVSDTTDSDGCYTVESIPAKSGGGVYVKQNGVWVQAL